MIISQYIADIFGSKKGMLRYFKFQFWLFFGRFNSVKPQELDKVKRLVFVCSGNICRSPIGMAVSHEIGFPSISFGLHCRGGDPAFVQTLNYAERSHLSLKAHHSSHIDTFHPITGDLLVVTEPAHWYELKNKFSSTPVLLLGLMAETPVAYIHDPFNTNSVYFDQCMALIQHLTTTLIDAVRD